MNARYGPDAICERTPCTADGPADHNGGAHLDPTDRTRYDGLRTGGLPSHVKNAAAELMRAVGAYRKPADTDTPIRALVDIALDAAFREIGRLEQQVAHISVDADHRIRDASRRALDCTDHGQTITGLEHALTAADQRTARHEKARLALLGEHQTITDLLTAWKQGSLDPDLTAEQLLTALETVNRKTSAAHKRAFNA